MKGFEVEANDEDEKFYATNELPGSVKITKDKKELCDVEVDLSEESFVKLALLAHEKDITINQLCNKILSEAIENNIPE
jgi:hypothetical protein